MFYKLNEIKFYKLPFPKSLGVEFVNELILPLIESFKIPTNNKPINLLCLQNKEKENGVDTKKQIFIVREFLKNSIIQDFVNL